MLPRMSPAALAEATEVPEAPEAPEATVSIAAPIPGADELVEPADDLLTAESLIEEISIDGMCGVY
jgi:mycofactocin precursor